MTPLPSARTEYALLGVLALLWGSSYLFIKVAVAEIPPLTLIAARVGIAAVFLAAVMAWRKDSLPRDAATWRMLLLQSFLNSIGAWVVLAWGQQFVDAGLASVLNSTAPIFVFLLTAVWFRHENTNLRKLFGAALGLGGVVLIVGVDALAGLGESVLGQLACLAGAMMYAYAAIYGKRFAHISPLATATGTMIWATVVLVPTAAVVDAPWTLRPSAEALLAVAVLAIVCTGAALMIYFRLLRTVGSIGTASQSYLRAGVGVILGIVFLGEVLTISIAAGIAAALMGMALINWPTGGKKPGR